MKLKKLLNIKKGSVLSIVGAGGKTTLMFSIAEELRKENKVLVTTTTKIHVPQKTQYDFISVNSKEFSKYSEQHKNGIYVYGETVTADGKLTGLSNEMLELQLSYFDYVLIEADGSKKKPVKGWNDNEPVVINSTEQTIGVLSIEVIGVEITDNNIHRVEKFMEITGSKKYEKISIETIISLIFNKRGLFKDSIGERVLFINKVETQDDHILANKLKEKILKINNGYIHKIIIGSLKSGEKND